jgi:RNA polymerase sigma factor (sigma-70 family)
MWQTREQAFELYLHDIHDLPLLDPTDEQRLVAHLLAGRDAQHRRADQPDLSPDERRHLDQLIAAGQRARDALIAAHLRLVVRIARQYTGHGLSLLDLVQEGNVGLMQAVDHYDPQHGARFATYAVWWIRHAIADAVAEARHPVRLPAAIRARLYRLYRARSELIRALGTTGREVRDLLPYLQPVVSLNQPLTDDSTQELAAAVADPRAELQLDAASQVALAEELKQLLDFLNAEERAVVALRFGLHGGPLRTRQDTAQQLGTSTERVRQLEARAVRKLRSSELIERLRDYIDS